jgi:hypothetical protein
MRLCALLLRSFRDRSAAITFRAFTKRAGSSASTLSRDRADDITSSQIIITDILITNGTNGALTFTLKDSAFSNISSVSDNFAGGDFSLVGDTFTFTTLSRPRYIQCGV